jgi:hypothetical protein
VAFKVPFRLPVTTLAKLELLDAKLQEEGGKVLGFPTGDDFRDDRSLYF